MTDREIILNKKPKNGYKFIYRYWDDDGSYIGQTKKSLKQRAGKDGNSYLTNINKWSDAIREKGINHFNVEILEECLECDADKIEKDYVKKFNSKNNGYNSTWGGKSYNPDNINSASITLCNKDEISQYINMSADICFNAFYNEVESPFDFHGLENLVTKVHSKEGYNIKIDNKLSPFYVKALPDKISLNYFGLPTSDIYSWQILYTKEGKQRCFLSIFNTATHDLITPFSNDSQDALRLLYEYPEYMFTEKGIVKQQLHDLDVLYEYLHEDKIDYTTVLQKIK